MSEATASERTGSARAPQGWVDVSVPIHSGMVTFPGNPEVALERVQSLERGDEATLSRLALGLHTGTHVDAPSHFIPQGAAVDALPIEALVGPARVIEVRDPRAVTAEELALNDFARGERVLFKTANSPRCWQTPTFVSDYVALSPSGARLLAALGVRTVGIDYLSIAAMDQGREVHRILLSAGVCIIEGLDMTQAAPGTCDLFCFPLRIAGAEGAPARVWLRY
jgi:arylformamidase